MNICIFSTFDNFFLKRLILTLIKKNPNYNFYFYFVSDYNNLNNILVKATSLGLVNCIYFFFKSLILDLFKKDLISSLNNKFILKKKSKEKLIIKFFKKNKIDLLVSINYPKYIPSKILKLCKYGGINHHLGKLPKYRGRYPVANAILNNENKMYVTVHHMDDKIDNGQTIISKVFSIKKYKKNFIPIYEFIFRKSERIISKSITKVFKKKRNKKIKIKFNAHSKYNNSYCTKLSLNQLLKLYLIKFL